MCVWGLFSLFSLPSPLSSPLFFPSLFSFSISFVLPFSFLFYSFLSHISIAHMRMGMGSSTRARGTCQRPCLMESWSSPFSLQLTVYRPLAGDGCLCTPPSSTLECWFSWSCVVFSPGNCSSCELISLLYSVDIFSPVLRTPWLLEYSHFLFHAIPWAFWAWVFDIDLPYTAGHAKDTRSLHFDQLWISVSTIVQSTNKFLSRRLRNLVHGIEICI